VKVKSSGRVKRVTLARPPLSEILDRVEEMDMSNGHVLRKSGRPSRS
jgi:hypothetical protein